MSQFNAKQIFENEIGLTDRLNRLGLAYNKDELIAILEYLNSTSEVMEKHGLVFLEYLLSANTSLDTKAKLSHIYSYYQVGKINDCIRKRIFKFAFEIHDTQQDLEDIEVYRLLYAILSSTCVEVCPEDEFNQYVRNSLMYKKRARRQQYDDVIENYLDNPKQYPPKQMNLDTDTMTMFALFNVLYGSTMRPIEFEGMEHFKFSDAWTDILHAANNSIYRIRIETEMEILKDGLKNYRLKRFLMNREPKSYDIIMDERRVPGSVYECKDKNELNMVIKEGVQSLKVAHPRFMATIGYALFCSGNTYRHESNTYEGSENRRSNRLLIDEMYYSIIQSILNELVFEYDLNHPYTLKRLLGVSACAYKFINEHRFPLAIWDNFRTQRDAFLCSIVYKSNQIVNLAGNNSDLEFIEKIIFTSVSQRE